MKFNQFNLLRTPDDGAGNQNGGGGAGNQQQSNEGGDGAGGTSQQQQEGQQQRQEGESNQQVTDTTAKPLIDDNGKLSPNWREHPDLKGFDFSKFEGKSNADILKSLGNAEKLISSKGGVIRVPETFDKSDPSVVAYRTTNGIPDDPAAYVVKPAPETLAKYGLTAEDWSEADALPLAQLSNEIGLTPAQNAKAAQAMQEMQMRAIQVQRDAEANQLAEAERELQREFGPAYRDKMDSVHRLIMSQGYDPNADFFKHPDAIRMIHGFTQLFGPEAIASMRGIRNVGGGYATNADEAHAIMTSKDHPDHESYVNGDKAAAAKVSRLLTR